MLAITLPRMFPKWFRYLVFFGLLTAAAAAYSVAYGWDAPPEARSIYCNDGVTCLSPTSSSSVYFVWYAFMSDDGAMTLDCGNLATIARHFGTTSTGPKNSELQLRHSCVGRTIKANGGTATVIYTTATPTPLPTPAVTVNNTNNFSPVNNITSSGSFTIGSASFSVDTAGLEQSVDSLKYPWLLALPFFLFCYVLFSVISAIRKK